MSEEEAESQEEEGKLAFLTRAISQMEEREREREKGQKLTSIFEMERFFSFPKKVAWGAEDIFFSFGFTSKGSLAQLVFFPRILSLFMP